MVGLTILSDFSSVAEDIGKKLIPNWISFTVQFAALAILVTVVFFVAYKPVKKILRKRSDYVEKTISDAEEKKKEAEKDVVAAKETVIASKKEAVDILANAKANANKVGEAMINETNKQISVMKKQVEEDIARSKENAKEEIRQEMVSVALSASSKILKREVNPEDNARLVEDFIKDIDK